MLLTQIFSVPTLALEVQNTGFSIVESNEKRFRFKYNGGSRVYDVVVVKEDEPTCRLIIRCGGNHLINDIYPDSDIATIVEKRCGIVVG